MVPTEVSQVQHNWQPTLVHSTAFPKCLKAQHKWQPNADNLLLPGTSSGWSWPTLEPISRCSRTKCLVAGFTAHESTTQQTLYVTPPKGQIPCTWATKVTFTLGVSPCTTAHLQYSCLPSHSQAESQPWPQTRQQQSKLNYNRKPHTTHTRDPLNHQTQVTRETAPLGLTGNLQHKATPLRPGDVADLPTTWKQTQEIG